MGTQLGISREVFKQAEAKFRSGFQVPPAGAHILWVIQGHKQGSYTNKSGEDVEYLQIICEMTDDDGQEYKHWQFFGLETKEDIQELKAFLVNIGREDWDPEEDDLEDLNGTQFRCDFTHYNSKNKSTGEVEVRGRFDWKTLVSVNWNEGHPAGSNDEEEAEKAAKPKKRGRPRKEPEPEDTDDNDDDDDGEEEEEGFKSFSPRKRRRRAAASDKD